VTGAETSFGYNTNSLYPTPWPCYRRPAADQHSTGWLRATHAHFDPGNINAQDVTATYDPNTTLLRQSRTKRQCHTTGL